MLLVFVIVVPCFATHSFIQTETDTTTASLASPTRRRLAAAKMSLNPVTEVLLQAVIAVIVIAILNSIVRLYLLRSKLPPGPFPLPVLGNILTFRQPKFSYEVMHDLSLKYGPVFTIFLGHQPNVIIADPQLGLQALKKHTFAGRPQFFFREIIFKPGTSDIAFTDFGKDWEAVRKVGHSAARKFAVSSQLPVIVTDAVDRLIARVGVKPFDSEQIIPILILNTLAQAAFGKKYNFNDPEFLRWMEVFEVQRRENSFVVLTNFLPFVRFLFYKKWARVLKAAKYRSAYVDEMFEKAEKNYEDGKNESFCDAIIGAKKETEEHENWMLPYLNNDNLHNVVLNLFTAGSDTTRISLQWIFVMLAMYPERQAKLREQVKELLHEDDAPTIDDMGKLPHVCAFISETMRFKPIIPTGLPHKTTIDEEVNGQKIPKNTTIVALLSEALSHETWGDPAVFRPERFLDENGNYVSKPNPLFIPFGDGRCSCPGNKLAFNNLFLMTTRFLQRTKDIQIIGGVTDELLRGDLLKTTTVEPIPYKVQLIQK
jgi:cytochrome P450